MVILTNKMDSGNEAFTMKNEQKDVRKTIAVIVIIVFVMFTFTFYFAPLSNAINHISEPTK